MTELERYFTAKAAYFVFAVVAIVVVFLALCNIVHAEIQG